MITQEEYIRQKEKIAVLKERAETSSKLVAEVLEEIKTIKNLPLNEQAQVFVVYYVRFEERLKAHLKDKHVIISAYEEFTNMLEDSIPFTSYEEKKLLALFIW